MRAKRQTGCMRWGSGARPGSRGPTLMGPDRPGRGREQVTSLSLSLPGPFHRKHLRWHLVLGGSPPRDAKVPFQSQQDTAGKTPGSLSHSWGHRKSLAARPAHTTPGQRWAGHGPTQVQTLRLDHPDLPTPTPSSHSVPGLQGLSHHLSLHLQKRSFLTQVREAW